MPPPKDAKEMRTTAPKNFNEAFEKVSPKDRANLQKHLDAVASMPHAFTDTWKGLLLTLSQHAPHACQTVGTEAVRFFVQDGTYKLQMFALEDKLAEPIRVYLPNVLEASIKAKLISRTAAPNAFTVAGESGEPILIDELDASTTIDAPVHFKFMIGLNRKALRVTFPSRDRTGLVKLISAMCDLAIRANEAAEARNKEALTKQQATPAGKR
ncbi:hypothetical protein [Humisphaera borealis]|uniref:Uncharacterized protein n=1 Tax=Humisphaera borealis TaxID=2807512 RepID=A0A7M2WR18_9BACT|nr:hypothetical protein [Humisphaera borealis]QOV87948.1 hypothetical protein IPV69_16960 [Humisphaera borealis]